MRQGGRSWRLVSILPRKQMPHLCLPSNIGHKCEKIYSHRDRGTLGIALHKQEDVPISRLLVPWWTSSILLTVTIQTKIRIVHRPQRSGIFRFVLRDIRMINPFERLHEPDSRSISWIACFATSGSRDISSIAGLTKRMALIRKKGSCSTLFSMKDKPESVLWSHCEDPTSITKPKKNNRTRTTKTGTAMTIRMANPAATAMAACL